MDARVLELFRDNFDQCIRYKGQTGVIYIFDPTGWQPEPGFDCLISFKKMEDLEPEARQAVQKRYLSLSWDFQTEFILMYISPVCSDRVSCVLTAYPWDRFVKET